MLLGEQWGRNSPDNQMQHQRWLLIMISIFIIISTNNIAKDYQQLILIQKGKKVSDMKADTLVQLLNERICSFSSNHREQF